MISMLCGPCCGQVSDWVMNLALRRKRLIAHVLMRDEQDRMPLYETQFKEDWELPGGIVEPLEPARLGAACEVREELGVDLQVGRLLVADWIPPHPGWDDAIEMIFDGGTVDENDLIGRCSRRRSRRSPWSTWLRQVSLTPLAVRRLSLAVALGPDEMAYTRRAVYPDLQACADDRAACGSELAELQACVLQCHG
jgi:8-oxo-dGTP diphosphatase